MQPSRSTWIAFLATVAFGACSAVLTPGPARPMDRGAPSVPDPIEAVAPERDGPSAGAVPGDTGSPSAARMEMDRNPGPDRD